MPFEDRATREARFDRVAAEYAGRYRGAATHAELLNVFRSLKQDLKDAGGDLDAESRRDWPSNGDVPAAELTIGEQFAALYDRAVLLAQHKNTISAEILRRRIINVLEQARRSASGFKAPATSERVVVIVAEQTIVPPVLIREAIEKVRPLTPHGAALATAQTGDSPEVATDRWRIALWAQELEV